MSEQEIYDVLVSSSSQLVIDPMDLRQMAQALAAELDSRGFGK